MLALGLKKMNQTVEHEATPQVLGMVKSSAPSEGRRSKIS